MAVAKTNYHHGDLRAALLEAALDIITERGPQKLTIREVARKAGVSHTAPYRHFANKDDLIVAVVKQGFELMSQTMLDKKTAAEADPISQFAASGTAYVDFALQHPAYYRVMYSGDLLTSTGQHTLQHTSAETFAELVSDVKTCQELGIIRTGNPTLQALSLLCTIHGFVTMVIDNRVSSLLGEGYPVDAIRDVILTTIFEGLGGTQAIAPST
ncbi:MAG: TetR/AcrR family transcriptional regulator [Halioglobus sp.]